MAKFVSEEVTVVFSFSETEAYHVYKLLDLANGFSPKLLENRFGINDDDGRKMFSELNNGILKVFADAFESKDDSEDDYEVEMEVSESEEDEFGDV